jgi:hypothetical protein
LYLRSRLYYILAFLLPVFVKEFKVTGLSRCYLPKVSRNRKKSVSGTACTRDVVAVVAVAEEVVVAAVVVVVAEVVEEVVVAEAAEEAVVVSVEAVVVSMEAVAVEGFASRGETRETVLLGAGASILTPVQVVVQVDPTLLRSRVDRSNGRATKQVASSSTCRFFPSRRLDRTLLSRRACGFAVGRNTSLSTIEPDV